MSVLLALLSYPFGSQMKVMEEDYASHLTPLQAITMGVMGLGMVMRDGLLFIGSMLFVLLSFGCSFPCSSSSPLTHPTGAIKFVLLCSLVGFLSVYRQVPTCQDFLTSLTICWADELPQLRGTCGLVGNKFASCWAVSCQILVKGQTMNLLLALPDSSTCSVLCPTSSSF